MENYCKGNCDLLKNWLVAEKKNYVLFVFAHIYVVINICMYMCIIYAIVYVLYGYVY